MTTLKKLIELASKATPGCISTNDPEDYADAKYISAANPSAIIKILDALETATKILDEAMFIWKMSIGSVDGQNAYNEAEAALEKLKELET